MQGRRTACRVLGLATASCIRPFQRHCNPRRETRQAVRLLYNPEAARSATTYGGQSRHG